MTPEILGMKTYGLLVTIGLIAGLGLFARRSRRAGIPAATAVQLGVFGLLVGAFGARLLHFLYLPEDYVPWYGAFLSLKGGFALNGGILGITVAVFCRARGLGFLMIADCMAPSAPLAVLFFRLGCFGNGCCVGRPTDLPWGIRLPAGTAAGMRDAGAVLHPTPIYAALNAVLILAVLLLLERRNVPRGTVFAVFMLMYGVLRTVLDLTRADAPYAAANGILPINQAVHVAIALFGAIVLWRVFSPGHLRQGLRCESSASR